MLRTVTPGKGPCHFNRLQYITAAQIRRGDDAMNDHEQCIAQLIAENEELRRRVQELGAVEAGKERTEQALRERERYRLLAETAPYPMCRCDANGELIEFNGRWYEYTGQTPEEARGSGWMRALHPDDRERVSQQLRQAVAAGEVCEVEYRLRKKDGSYRWHLARSLPMKDMDGRIVYRFGSAADIEDQKRAEEESRKNRAILQAAIECLPFDFFAIGEDGRYLLENAVCRANWGRLVGKTPAEMAPTDAVRALWLDNNRRAFAG